MFGEKRNGFVLMAGDWEEGDERWVLKVLLLFKITVKNVSEIQEYAFS